MKNFDQWLGNVNLFRFPNWFTRGNGVVWWQNYELDYAPCSQIQFCALYLGAKYGGQWTNDGFEITNLICIDIDMEI